MFNIFPNIILICINSIQNSIYLFDIYFVEGYTSHLEFDPKKLAKLM